MQKNILTNFNSDNFLSPTNCTQREKLVFFLPLYIFVMEGLVGLIFWTILLFAVLFLEYTSTTTTTTTATTTAGTGWYTLLIVFIFVKLLLL